MLASSIFDATAGSPATTGPAGGRAAGFAGSPAVPGSGEDALLFSFSSMTGPQFAVDELETIAVTNWLPFCRTVTLQGERNRALKA
jgi:hypothetical protein